MWPSGRIPTTERDYAAYCRTGWFLNIGGEISTDDAAELWKKEKTVRNKANVGEDVRDGLKAELDQIIAAKKAA